MPIHSLPVSPGRFRETASTVYGVFLDGSALLDSRHGLPATSMHPILPVVGQWQLRTSPSTSTDMVNWLLRLTMVPSVRGGSNSVQNMGPVPGGSPSGLVWKMTHSHSMVAGGLSVMS